MPSFSWLAAGPEKSPSHSVLALVLRMEELRAGHDCPTQLRGTQSKAQAALHKTKYAFHNSTRVIRELQTKITMPHHYIPTRESRTKSSDTPT